MFGTIEVPKNFYDYDKRDEAMMTTRQAPKPAVKTAAVGAEKKGLKQAAVQQANAEKDAVKAATATVNKAEKNAAAEHRSEPVKGKTGAGDTATKQEAKQAAPGFQGVIGIFLPAFMLLLALRSNPASISPVMVPPTGYLRLPPPASTSSGSQQLRLCDQGVCKSDSTAVKEVELLADVGPWLKESSEQVRESRLRVPQSVFCARRYTFPHSRIMYCLCTCAFLHLFVLRHSCDPSPSQRGQVSLSDNVTAVLLPEHELFAMPPANFAKGNGRCAPAPVLSLPTSPKPCRALARSCFSTASSPHFLPAAKIQHVSQFPHAPPAGIPLATRYALSPVPHP